MLTEDKRSLSLRALVPNMITITGLCAGLTAIRFIMAGRFDLAAMLIVFAAVLDGMDGLIARRLNVQSNFGAELDSLSDFLNFGVAPGLLVYQFSLVGSASTTWVFVLVYAICACLRLARFNLNRDVPPPPDATPQFTGVPSPGGALLALLPVFLSLQGLLDARALPFATGVYLALVGLLMISTIPTPSPKALRIPRDRAMFVLLGMGVVAGLMVTRFWLLMVALGVGYLFVIGWAMVKFLRQKRG